MTARSRRRPDDPSAREAERLMRAFAERTCVASAEGCRHRYLWTDAFAVCNFLALHAATGAPEHLSSARALADRVHEGLGRHRPDGDRGGAWLSGLPEEQGRRHPTLGGLRIGKPLPERGPGEPFDERLEWKRDGQYFHYLTRWVHALICLAMATRERAHLERAVELATTAHRSFVFTDAHGQRRMHWKMSIDLSRPLVATMGHHDPLDGLLTCLELRVALDDLPLGNGRAQVAAMVDDFESLTDRADWTTDDALGIGGLLSGACTLAQASLRGAGSRSCSVSRLLDCAADGIAALGHEFLVGHAERRLAFRELGLAIGLRAVPHLQGLVARHPALSADRRVAAGLARMLEQVPLASSIEQFWLDPVHRASSTWIGHRDINEVMLATSLLAGGCRGV